MKPNDDDDDDDDEDGGGGQQYTVHVQAVPEPTVTLPVVHVPDRSCTMRLPKTSTCSAAEPKHLPRLVQTDTNGRCQPRLGGNVQVASRCGWEGREGRGVETGPKETEG